MYKTIETEELKKLMAEQSIVLAEALPKSYFEQGHIPGAINLPLDSKDEDIRALIPNPDTTIVTYCTGPTCPNSRRLANRLTSLGYNEVAIYELGKARWLDDGGALEPGLKD